jgi:hypothetical protein
MKSLRIVVLMAFLTVGIVSFLFRLMPSGKPANTPVAVEPVPEARPETVATRSVPESPPEVAVEAKPDPAPKPSKKDVTRRPVPEEELNRIRVAHRRVEQLLLTPAKIVSKSQDETLAG